MSHPQRGGDEMSPRSLQAILAPLSVDEFRNKYSGRSPLYVSGVNGRFRHLFNWDDLARLLESHSLESPRLKIVKAGKTIAQERYLRHLGEMTRIDGGVLSLLLDEGATLIINVIDDLVPPIAELADEVGESLGGRPAVNLYATWRSEHGFDPHSDYHDVLVLQLAGRKEWAIHKPTRTDPLRGDAFEAPPAGSQPDRVETLEDGDLLYLPRGWIHAPVPAGEPSLHLTISLTYPTGAGFLDWLTTQLKSEPEVRAAIPGSEARPAWTERMSAILREAITGDSVDRYLMHKEARRTARPHFSFPDFGRIPPTDWDESTVVRPSSQHRLVIEHSADGGSMLVAAGHLLPCSRPVAAALARPTSTRPVTLGELEAELSVGEVTQFRQLLKLLTTFGLLQMTRGNR